MSCARSRSEYLAARDARHEQVLAACGLAREVRAGAVVVVGANLPGPDKNRPGLETLVRRSLAALNARGVNLAPAFVGTDLLGPYRVLVASEPASTVKPVTVEVEQELPAGRVLDLDVLTPDGDPVDRRSLGLEPRCCYACDRPARECILLARHTLPELLAAVDALLALADAP
jgi:holo-ACP synthase CitX